MHRFPINCNQINNSKATISGSDYKHITKALRLVIGDAIILFDEKGIEYTAIITTINNREIGVEIVEQIKTDRESKLNITLLQGMPKADKMDFIVEKATELGVKKIVPVITNRTQVKNTRKIPRWRRIAIESAKQSRRTSPSIVNDAVNFEEIIKLCNNDSQLKLIFYENSENNLKLYISNITQTTTDIDILIGPEGGFSASEVQLAERAGFYPVKLGPRILRTETAGIAAISIIQYIFGDF